MNLRKAAFSATRWTTAAAVFRAVLQLIQTAVLARLLAPADFGLMAMAGVVVAVATLFSDLGLSSALMHFAHPSRETLSTLYWLNLALACGLALLFAGMAWPLASVYEQPVLLSVLVWMSLSFPLSALGQPFRVLAEKRMHFKTLSQNESAAAVTGFTAGLAIAIADGGVYALVAASLSFTATNSVLAWVRLSSDVRPQAIFRYETAKPFLSFGLHRVGDSFWNTLRMQTDIFIAGVIASPAAVAAYAIPRDQCLKFANTIINPVITRVGLPVMTRLQDNPQALRAVYLKTLRMTASFNFPVYALVALFPEQIVSLLLGPQWNDAAFYLRLFALWGLIRSTGNPSGSLLYAVGMARRAHLWNLFLMLATAPLLWIAATLGGLPTLAWAMLVWQAAILFLAWRFLILPACGATFMLYLSHMASPLAAAMIASLFALATAAVLPEKLGLPFGTCSFFVSYLIFSWLLNRECFDAMRELLSPLIRAMR